MLTQHLLSRASHTKAYAQATQSHPWLQAAASGSLPDSSLAYWLFQDRIYAAQAYPRFIGAIIARHTLDHDTLSTLVFSLQNILREVEFFESTAQRYGLNLDVWKERKPTRDYTAEMARVSERGTLVDGLVFLWAMEKAYLDAWTTVHRGLQQASVGDVALAAFAHNWSTNEFVEFVDNLARLVDALGIDPSSLAGQQAEAIWDRVVELEYAFWPEDAQERQV